MTQRIDELTGKGKLSGLVKKTTKLANDVFWKDKPGDKAAPKKVAHAKVDQANALSYAVDHHKGKKYWLKQAKDAGDKKRAWSKRLEEKLTPDAKKLVKRAINGNKKLVRPIMKLALSQKKNKEPIREALSMMSENNLDGMRANIYAVLSEKASDALENKKTEMSAKFLEQ